MYPRESDVSHTARHSRAVEPDDQLFDVSALRFADRHAIGWVQGIVHSTMPVFSDGGDRVGERRLPIWKLQEEGVVLTVLDGRQLAVDHTSTLAKILSDHDAHVAKRQEVVDIIFQGYG